MARLFRFHQLARIGRWEGAQSLWDQLDPKGVDWARARYRLGDAERSYVWFRFWQGNLSEDDLAGAEQLATTSKNRTVVRWLHGLRGAWRLQRAEWALAAESLQEAVTMARAVGRRTDPIVETQFALARFHLGQLEDPHREAEQLANANQRSDGDLADLFFAIGDHEQAKKHALISYRGAWANGEPYVWRQGLNNARALLEKLGEPIPKLPSYDPSKYEKFPCEDEVAAAIEKLRARNP